VLIDVMIPIMDSPKVVRQFTNHFSTTLSYHHTKRTEQHLTGIITGRKVTVRSIASRLVEPADQSSLKPVPNPVPLGRGRTEPKETGKPPIP